MNHETVFDSSESPRCSILSWYYTQKIMQEKEIWFQVLRIHRCNYKLENLNPAEKSSWFSDFCLYRCRGNNYVCSERGSSVMWYVLTDWFIAPIELRWMNWRNTPIYLLTRVMLHYSLPFWLCFLLVVVIVVVWRSWQLGNVWIRSSHLAWSSGMRRNPMKMWVAQLSLSLLFV